MKSVIGKGLIAAAVIGTLMLPVIANAGPWVNNVNKRLARQHARIHQGVKSGQVTKAERLRDNAHDARIRARVATDRAHDNGHLTRGEHARLERSLNRNSRAIYRTKHNYHIQ